jgi:tyrosine-protein kinase Etk/Wzc
MRNSATPGTLSTESNTEINEGRWIIVADTLDSPQPAPKRRLARWLDLFLLAGQHKRGICAITVATTVVSLGIAFTMPDNYIATTQLLPPQQSQSSVAALLGQFGELASLAGKDVSKTPSAIFVSLLRSRTIADSLISSFALMQVYRAQRLSQCRERLAARTTVEATREGVIVIAVSDRNPRLAAELANAYVSGLIAMNQKLAVGEAAQRRLFFEKQVQAAREQLASAENAMKNTQETTGMIQLDSQAKAFIESTANLRAHIAIQQVQVEQMRTFATEQNPDLVRKQEELASLRAELRQLQQEGFTVGVETPGSKLPAAGLEYVRRLREVKYSEAVFELLSKHLEAARIDEARNGAAIQVIDRAEIPDRKNGPNRLLIALLGWLAGCSGSLLWVLANDVLARANSDPDTHARLARLKNTWLRLA